MQRSRKYVRESQKLHKSGQEILFPEPQDPKVQEYDLTKIYGPLINKFIRAFDKKKPLLNLSMYNPYEHFLGEEDDSLDFNFEKGRKRQVIALIRTSLLKRFESSYYSFKESCHRLLIKMYYWTKLNCKTENEKKNLERILKKNMSYFKQEFSDDDEDDGDVFQMISI